MDATLKHKMIFVGPVILYLLIFTIWPLLHAVGMSLTNLQLTSPASGQFVGLRNYIALLSPGSPFIRALVNNAILIAAALSIQLAMGYIVARLFYSVRDMMGINIIRVVYIIPIMITPLVFGLVSVYIFNPSLGIANHIATSLGLEALPWYGATETALLTVAIVDIWQWTPFIVIILFSGMLSIPLELFENADVDGANLLQKVFMIEIPYIRRVIAIAVLMRLMELIRMFDLVYVTTRGGPGGASDIVSMFTYRQAFNRFNTGLGAAAAIIALILTVSASMGLYKMLRGSQS